MRAHKRRVFAEISNHRWSSDGLEIVCWNGEVVRVAFAIDTRRMAIFSKKRVQPSEDGCTQPKMLHSWTIDFAILGEREYLVAFPLPSTTICWFAAKLSKVERVVEPETPS